jgi:hypothetical protein
MGVTAAAETFFLDVGDFTTGSHLAIAADDAATNERRVPEKSNETHERLTLDLR